MILSVKKESKQEMIDDMSGLIPQIFQPGRWHGCQNLE
jgi:hypothetical protein